MSRETALLRTTRESTEITSQAKARVSTTETKWLRLGQVTARITVRVAVSRITNSSQSLRRRSATTMRSSPGWALKSRARASRSDSRRGASSRATR